jgi:hypothetical protein
MSNDKIITRSIRTTVEREENHQRYAATFDGQSLLIANLIYGEHRNEISFNNIDDVTFIKNALDDILEVYNDIKEEEVNE